MSYKGKVVLFANKTDWVLIFLSAICLLIGGLMENSENTATILFYIAAGIKELMMQSYGVITDE